ncbi:ABC transporter permease, partial [Acidovorax cavernicola]
MPDVIDKPAAAAPRRGWRQSDSPVKRAFARSRTVQVAAAVLLLIVLATLFAPWLAWQNPFDSASLELNDAFLPPWSEGSHGAFHMLGADDQGRDVASAILYGLRMSVLVGVSAVLLSLCIGVPLGLLAGYAGGWFDTLLMRLADVQLT